MCIQLSVCLFPSLLLYIICGCSSLWVLVWSVHLSFSACWLCICLLPICLSVFLSACVCLLVVYLYVFFTLSVCLSVHLSVSGCWLYCTCIAPAVCHPAYLDVCIWLCLHMYTCTIFISSVCLFFVENTFFFHVVIESCLPSFHAFFHIPAPLPPHLSLC